MAALHDVLLRPLETEKSEGLRETENVYAFQVGLGANKHQIALAVQTLFNVRVVDVRTLRVRGKFKRFGRHTGRRSNWKKAYVKLASGDSIRFTEG